MPLSGLKSAYATRKEEKVMSRVVDPRVMATVRLTFDTSENDNLLGIGEEGKTNCNLRTKLSPSSSHIGEKYDSILK